MRPIATRCDGSLYFVENISLILLYSILKNAHTSQILVTTSSKISEIFKPILILFQQASTQFHYIHLSMLKEIYMIDCEIDKPEHSNNNKISLQTGLNLIIESNVYIFNNKHCKQTKGAPMGSPISGRLVEFKLRLSENYILKNIKPAPSTQVRYADHMFGNQEHGLETQKYFLEKINKVDNDIQCTIEIENNNIFPFFIFCCKKEL